jgi:hypothetical protein
MGAMNRSPLEPTTQMKARVIMSRVVMRAIILMIANRMMEEKADNRMRSREWKVAS